MTGGAGGESMTTDRQHDKSESAPAHQAGRALELTPQDSLRLHVLASECEAIRIDEADMSVRGLAGGAERVVHLDGGGQPQRYLKAVRELLSSIALGSPGGYPLVLGRWTRTGQLHNLPLEKLLRLAEPEAVVAVAIAGNLTADMARLAWWANPTTEIARYLLAHDDVRRDELGRRLAAHLLEHLPFETEAIDVTRSVRAVLGARGMDPADVDALWRRGRRKNAIWLGFVQARPFDLPGADGTGITPGDVCDLRGVLLSARGRILFATVESILSRPADPEIVVECLDTLSSLLARIRPAAGEFTSIENIERRVADAGPAGDDDTSRRLRAIAFLSLAGEPLVRDHFARSTAVGSLMRRQLAPLLDPVCRELAIAAAGQVVP